MTPTLHHARTLSALVRSAIGALTDACSCPRWAIARVCAPCVARFEIERIYSTIPRFSLGMKKRKARK